MAFLIEEQTTNLLRNEKGHRFWFSTKEGSLSFKTFMQKLQFASAHWGGQPYHSHSERPAADKHRQHELLGHDPGLCTHLGS